MPDSARAGTAWPAVLAATLCGIVVAMNIGKLPIVLTTVTPTGADPYDGASWASAFSNVPAAASLATNAGDSVEVDIRAALARVELNSLIDRVFCSREVGHNKPSPEFFAFIKKALALPDEDLVMVGDNFQKDVEGATKCGIRAVWFRPGQEPAAPAARVLGVGARHTRWCASSSLPINS